MPRLLNAALVAALLSFPLLMTTPAGGEEQRPDAKRAIDLFPSTTVLYAEIARPAAIVDGILEHPLRPQIEAHEGYRAALESKEYREFQLVRSVIEARLGATWREAFGQLTAGGIYAGVDAPTQGLAILARARDEERLGEMLEALLQLAREDAERKGEENPIETDTYRGITVYDNGESKFARLGPWLVTTNKPKLGKRIVDTWLDGGDKTLSANPRWRQARQARAGDPALWLYADVGALRDAGVAGELFGGRTENIVAELLVGGLLGNLRKTPYATASLYLEPQQARLALRVPHDPAWVGEAREHFFGPGGKGAAPPPIATKETLLSLTAYRDLSQMWLRAGDLLNEKGIDELAKAESGLSTLFSGKDFGEEVLGVFGPELQIVAERQDFAGSLPRPAIKLPSFALAFRLHEPEKVQGELRRTFQSLIGFLNVVGAMNGQPQLDLDMQKDAGRQIVSAQYLPEEEERESTEAKIHFNFSPSIAFAGDRFVIASTRELADRLTDARGAALVGKEDAEREPANTRVVTHAAVLRQVLRDNRGQLVAQNMIEEGHSKQEAEQAIEMLLEIVGAFRSASLNLDAAPDALQLELQLDLADLDRPPVGK